MDLHLLGPVEAVEDGRSLVLGATKQRAVLAMLALQPNRTVSVDRLIEGLWGEDAPSSAAKMVQQYVSHLRRVFEGSDAQILTRGRGYELAVRADAVDVVRFAQLVAAGSNGGNGAPRDALALWRGPALADVAGEPFAAPEIRHLEELRQRALELAFEHDLDAGRHADAVAELNAAVAAHPLSERLHALRILALYRSGRQAEALDAYREARAALVEHAGVEPGPELRELHERVLRQDPALDVPRATPDAAVASGEPVPPPPPPAQPTPPAQPAPPAPSRGPRRRRGLLLVGAALATLAAVLVALVLWGDDGLSGIDEDTVGRIDAGGATIDAQYRVGRGPGAVVSGAGSVWVASDRDRTVTRIDPSRDRVATIDPGGDPAALAFGAGSLWVADGRSTRVLQVDPRVDRVVQSVAVTSVPRALTVGFGALWVAGAGDGALTRIDLRSGRTGRPKPLGMRPTALVAGAGAVWAVSESAGVVARIEPRTGATVRTTPVGGGPTALALGAGGVWVANRDDGTVSRLDPSTGAVTDTVRVGRSPVAIAAGGKAVWTANAGDGTVSKIDAASRRVEDTVELGGSPAGVAVADGSAWATAGVRPQAHRGGTLRVGIVGGTDDLSLDPASKTSYNPDAWRLMSTVYDGLVTYRRVAGAAGGELVPDLAESLPRPTDGGRTYVFTLRRGLRYSDGTPVRPGDFRASLERFLRATGVEAPQIFASIVGAGRCAEQPARCDLSTGIATDARARTITIRLTRPDAELLHHLAHPFAFVVPAAAGPPVDGPAVPPPGTGPYRAAEVRAQDARLVRNPHFRSWSPDARPPGFPDEIRFTAKQGVDVDVQAGDVVPPPPERQALAARYGGRLRVESNPMIEYLFLNTHVRPFDDVRVRRALNLAVDRDRVVELRGGPETAQGTCRTLPPGLTGHRPDCPFPHDPAAARRLVARSGTRGARVPLWTFKEFRPLSRYLASVLRDLGYRPAVRDFGDGEAYFSRINQIGRRPAAGLSAWFADVLSPSSFIGPLFACRDFATNYSELCDRRLDAMTAAAAQARDPSEAARRWDAVERRIADLAPVVPLLHSQAYVLLSERAGNYQRHPLWGPLLDQMWVR